MSRKLSTTNKKSHDDIKNSKTQKTQHTKTEDPEIKDADIKYCVIQDTKNIFEDIVGPFEANRRNIFRVNS